MHFIRGMRAGLVAYTRIACVAAAGMVLAAGCARAAGDDTGSTGGVSHQAARPVADRVTATPTRTSTPMPSGSPGASQSPLPKSSGPASDNVAPKSKVKPLPHEPRSGAVQPRAATRPLRNGHRAHPSVTAKPKPMHKPVVYPDGVTVEILHIGHEKWTQQGPGMRPGERITAFRLRLTNHSKKSVDLNQVVVTATVDDGRLAAQPAYLDDTNDFYGTVRPGASQTTTYAFTIPTAQLDGVVLGVDFDGRHTVATFTGSAR